MYCQILKKLIDDNESRPNNSAYVFRLFVCRKINSFKDKSLFVILYEVLYLIYYFRSVQFKSSFGGRDFSLKIKRSEIFALKHNINSRLTFDLIKTNKE